VSGFEINSVWCAGENLICYNSATRQTHDKRVTRTLAIISFVLVVIGLIMLVVRERFYPYLHAGSLHLL
jgi:hypothetical protein